MGPIMLDVLGTSLTPEDKELLQHPLVGGLILFTRNFESVAQISALVTDIRKVAHQDFLIAVDHEGGRVQRFRPGFSKIPAMGSLWMLANENMAEAKILAKQCGVLIALEVQSIGIDISFAPVLDVNGISAVIGDRGFHQQPEHVAALASSFIDGMHHVGMKATGKHFPGHGSVAEDSHLALPIDKRLYQEVANVDLLPFKKLIAENKLDALMPAHVIFPDVDSEAVGFSALWLKEILRKQLGFDGVIFSDDLSMEGAACVGGYIERAEAAQQAGCDMLLLCNNRAGCIDVIDHANININSLSTSRLKRLLKTQHVKNADLTKNADWRAANKLLTSYL
ncbi:MAG: beta-N-acetylhexosaminidase [Alteromonadaceae bacterium]|jgi:beta-N-acetylhexosaminidase